MAYSHVSTGMSKMTLQFLLGWYPVATTLYITPSIVSKNYQYSDILDLSSVARFIKAQPSLVPRPHGRWPGYEASISLKDK